MPFLPSFDDYPWEPKKAPKDPELDPYENRYTLSHEPLPAVIRYRSLIYGEKFAVVFYKSSPHHY